MRNQRKQATIKDIAKLAQTSIATVSWVLNGSSEKFVSDGLRGRVLAAAQELDYQPNPLAQRLRGKARKLIAIVVPQFENVFFNQIVIGAEEYADQKGYKLLICSTDDQPQKEAELVNQLIANWVDGILMAPTYEGKAAIELISKANIPLVILDRPIDENHDYVGIDNYNSSYIGAEYLYKKGHRRFAYIGWDTPLRSLTDRTAGFSKALTNSGLAPENILIRKCERSFEAGYPLVQEMLEFKPTAFFIDQNTIAEGAIRALREHRLQIPEDISVLIYGEPAWARMNVPEFSCVGVPTYEVGFEGAKILVKKIESSNEDERKVIELAGEIIERESIKQL